MSVNRGVVKAWGPGLRGSLAPKPKPRQPFRARMTQDA